MAKICVEMAKTYVEMVYRVQGMNRFVNFSNNLPRVVTGGAVTVSDTCSVRGAYRAC